MCPVDPCADVVVRAALFALRKPDSRLSRNGFRKGIVDVTMLVTWTICPQTTTRQMEFSKSVYEERMRI